MANFDAKYPGAVEFIAMGGYGHDYTSDDSLKDRKLAVVQNISDAAATVNYKVDCRSEGVIIEHTGIDLPAGDILPGFIFDFEVTAGGPVRCFFQKGEAQ